MVTEPLIPDNEMGKINAKLRDQLIKCNSCGRRGKVVTEKFCSLGTSAVIGCTGYRPT